MENDNAGRLNGLVPPSFVELTDLRMGPVRVFKHRETGFPLAIVPGGYQGRIIGAILYYREPGDSMNMQIETTFDDVPFTIRLIERGMADTRPRDSVDGLWGRFLDNLTRYLATKTGFVEGGPSRPLIPSDEVEQTEPAPQNNDEDEGTESTEECMICMDADADTIVSPCFHSVVCSGCSRRLEATNDANICSRCRAPIDGVFYPDNTVRTISQ